jgi:glucose/arabinose dehydrogenase
MSKRRWAWIVIVVALLTTFIGLAAQRLVKRYVLQGLHVLEVARGLEVPWSMAFLPDGSMLVTERPGRLRLVDLKSGRVGAPIAGLPPVVVRSEGGLLGVVLAPDFASSQRIYWSFSEPAPAGQEGASTAVARGRLDGNTLRDVEVIFRQPVKRSDGRHFGGRLLFDDQGHLFVGLGDRMLRDDAQRLDSAHGKLLRLMPDGSVPADNPFIGRVGALGAIWSMGHRNIQGLAFNPQTGSLWASEHGPAGGDEINLIKAGANYGWPVVTHGCEYTTCAKIGEGSSKPGMEDPLAWFGPESVPPSSLLFVTSERYPAWKGQLLMSVLGGRALVRMTVQGDRIVERESIWLGQYNRVRDVRQGPDGWIYLAVENPSGVILRIEP